MTKNPFMSWWLSEWHRAANAAHGQFAAEASRRQQEMMQTWTRQATEFWMAAMFPWATTARPRGTRARRSSPRS
jgi:hypothetical protein